MTETSRAILRRLLLGGYDDYVRRLTSRLGSRDLADEALQDTFLRLERAAEIGPIQRPHAYLWRMVLNMAANRRAAEGRLLAASEIEAILDLPDEAPDPARTAEARSEIEMVKRALLELPARRREIALAFWAEEAPLREIAQRFGVSIRTVQIEIRHAAEHCAQRLGRAGTKKFASGPGGLSSP